MTTTTTSSSNENPRAVARRVACVTEPARARGEVPQRQEHAERKHGDHGADDDDQQRLDRSAQILEVVVDLALVEVRDLVEHLAERAGLLADRDHLQRERREEVGRLRRAIQTLAALDAVAQREHAFGEVTRCPWHARSCSSAWIDGQARLERQRERAADLRERGAAHDAADDRHVELELVPAIAARRIADEDL